MVRGSTWVLLFLRDFVAGQERFQGCDAGLDFGDLCEAILARASLKLGHSSRMIASSYPAAMPEAEADARNSLV